MRANTEYRRSFNSKARASKGAYAGKKPLSLISAKNEWLIAPMSVPPVRVHSERGPSTWNMSNLACKRHSSVRSTFRTQLRKSYLARVKIYRYSLYLSDVPEMSERATFLTEMRRARFPVQIATTRESLISEYHSLVDHEMSHSLDNSERERLREVEAELDRFDSGEEVAAQALADYKTGVARLRELNQLAKRLKELA